MCLQLQPKEHGHAVHQGKITGQVRTPDSFATTAAALKDGHWGIKGHHTLNQRQGRRHSREMPCLWADMLNGMWPVAVIWNGSHVSFTTARCMFVWKYFQIYRSKESLWQRPCVTSSNDAIGLVLSFLTCYRVFDRTTAELPGKCQWFKVGSYRGMDSKHSCCN